MSESSTSSLQIEATVNKKTYSFLKESNKRLNILFGGAGSGKSWAIAQFLLLEKFYKERNVGILIVRKTGPALKKSCWRLINNLIREYNLPLDGKNKTDLMLSWRTNRIIFTSLDDPEKIKCYHPDTEILTDNGFVPVAEVSRGDRVASMNPHTREASFEKVSKTWSYDYDGKMVRPKSATGRRRPYIDFCVTPDHRMLISTVRKPELRFVEAGKLPSVYIIPRTASWDGKVVDTWKIPRGKRFAPKKTEFPIVPFLKFLGWFISEGSFGDRQRYQLFISQTNKIERQQLEEDLREFPYAVWKSETYCSVSGRDLYNYLEKHGRYCYEKRIPKEILTLAPSLLKHLFLALMAGDGSTMKSGRYVYSTTSRGLVDDVSLLAMKLGYAVSIDERKADGPGYYPNGRTYWSISISNRDTARLEHKETIDYKGKVHCLEVPPHHTVCTRYHGKVMWCGQSIEGVNYVWGEEATEYTKDDFRQLGLRCRAANPNGMNQLYFSFNPIDEQSFLREVVETPSEKVAVNHSTYKDNAFLPEDYVVDEIESLEGVDETYWKIYGLGEWATPENIIYTNWDIVEDFPPDADVGYGLDFGWNVPTAFVKVGQKDNEIWLHEEIYETQLTNADLISRLKEDLKIPRSKKIVADSAEPQRIEEIDKAGFNVHPSIKGQDSLRSGIDRCKAVKLHITKDSVNLIKEIRGYKWKTDKNDMVLDEPVKFMDHGMDGFRYYVAELPIKTVLEKLEIANVGDDRLFVGDDEGVAAQMDWDDI